MSRRAMSIFLSAALALPLTACAAAPAPTAPWTAPAQTEPATTTPQTEPVTAPEPAAEDLVPVTAWLPQVRVELKYASTDNFTGQLIYEFQDVYLRYGTLGKLARVQSALEDQGLGLKIWDGFRPTAAQFRLWEVCPDPTYVADPRKGYSNHSRGNAVDVTLVDGAGNELPMPTGFDDFSALADRDYSDCPEEAARNALLLQTAMEEQGFKGYFGEWWHFADTDDYPVEEDFQPLDRSWYTVPEETPLRAAPRQEAEPFAALRPGSVLQRLAQSGAFSLIDCNGLQAYVPTASIRPFP